MDIVSYLMGKAAGGGSPGPSPEPALPDEYQRVEYLDFTPDAGFQVNIPIKSITWTVECASDTTDSHPTIFGYRVNSYTTNDFYFYIANVDSVQSLTVWNKGSSIYLKDDALPVIVGKKMKFSALFSTGSRGKAFIGRYSEKSGEYYGWDGKFYSIKGHDPMTQGLVADFVPCYKKADNIIGIYDTVAKVFYSELTASGSGAVTKGPDVN